MNVSSGTSLDVGRVLSILRARWYIVLGCMALVMAAAYAYAEHVAKPRFEASALVSYEPPRRDGNPTGGVLPASNVNRENVQTLIPIAGEVSIVKAAAAVAGVEAQELQRSVNVQAHGDGLLVDFVGTAGTAKQAAKLANSYATTFVEDRRTKVAQRLDAPIRSRVAEIKALGKPNGPASEDPNAISRNTLQTSLSQLRSDKEQWVQSIAVAAEAQPPVEPVWPRTTLTLFAAGLVGLGLGIGMALLTARADRQLHGDEFDDLPAPVMVRVPDSPRAPRSAPLGPDQAEPIVADSFAALGARVMVEHAGDGALVVLVTSARSGEGKSTVAANLASALAQGGRRVVLVDADMRKPAQDVIFPVLQGRPGLSQILTRTAEVERSLTLVAPNLAAIGSGPRQTNASVLLASVAFRQLVERLAGISEIVVIDAPPVLAVTDGLAIAPVANQVLLCARVGASNVVELEEAHSRLASAARTPQAIVLLGVERPSGYGYDGALPGRVAMPQPQARYAPQASAQAAPAAPGHGATAQEYHQHDTAAPHPQAPETQQQQQQPRGQGPGRMSA